MSTPAPTRLVESGTRHYGRLAARPADANPLDQFTGLSRRLRGLRLKEWVGFTLLHPDWYSSLIIQDAHYLASSEIYAYDRARAELHQHAANARAGAPALPTRLLDDECRFERPGYRIAYEFSAATGRHRIRLDIAATAKAPAITGELELHAATATAPLSVSSRLPGGSMYTHKAAFPAAGTLRVGEAEIVFDPARDLAVLDEHRSLLPYRTTWTWGTFATLVDGVPLGANFAARPELPGEPEESCLWTPGACEALGEITFTPESAAPAAPWRIASADGRLDVVFEPEGRKAVKHQFGVLAIDYFQLFGRYRGTLRGEDGRTYGIKDVHGVCERMRARL
ncbi:DUF2804 domain-containing protein [Streptacidiphilus jiangxiensis]|uniref:DUF2804 domain-containing protein n=1 Tax=Streptacidiphilus jiangxiensis TaxID=235985 RepID=A0A1H7TM91_STRJI|nr:DUF2804 domain-containing protein [Streptacidiphilus jiangxiensis]SEL85609.1 Protein of unknown function [Streptacidiphilus jiangxiensis]